MSSEGHSSHHYEEVEKATKTGRKRYMLSGWVDVAPDTGDATSVVRCRLFQRGEGWETRQERSLCGAGLATLVLTYCILCVTLKIIYICAA